MCKHICQPDRRWYAGRTHVCVSTLSATSLRPEVPVQMCQAHLPTQRGAGPPAARKREPLRRFQPRPAIDTNLPVTS